VIQIGFVTGGNAFNLLQATRHRRQKRPGAASRRHPASVRNHRTSSKLLWMQKFTHAR